MNVKRHRIAGLPLVGRGGLLEYVLASDYDALAAQLAEAERANAELNVEVSRLYACRNELQDVTRAIGDPRVNNTRSLESAIHAMKAQLAEAREALRVALNQDGDHSPTCPCRLCRAERERDALREAVGKVTCKACDGTGAIGDNNWPCPDCADLRRRLANAD